MEVNDSEAIQEIVLNNVSIVMDSGYSCQLRKIGIEEIWIDTYHINQGGESSEKGGDSTVIIHSGKVSLSDKLSAVNKIAVDVCSNCNESCMQMGLRVKPFNVIYVRDGFMLHVRILVTNITNHFPLLQSLYQTWYTIVNTISANHESNA